MVLRLLLGLGTEFGWPEGCFTSMADYSKVSTATILMCCYGWTMCAVGSLTFDVRAWSGMLPDDHRIETAEIALLDRPTERLYHFLSAGADLVDELDESDPFSMRWRDHWTLRMTLLNCFQTTFYESVRGAVSQLEADLHRLSQRLSAY